MFLKKPELYQQPDDAWENCVVEAEGESSCSGPSPSVATVDSLDYTVKVSHSHYRARKDSK